MLAAIALFSIIVLLIAKFLFIDRSVSYLAGHVHRSRLQIVNS